MWNPKGKVQAVYKKRIVLLVVLCFTVFDENKTDTNACVRIHIIRV